MSRHIRHITPVSQPQGSNLCWAAVTAMVLGRSGRTVVQDILREARAAQVPIYSNDSLNETTGLAALAAAFQLQCVNVSGVLAGQAAADRMLRAPCGFFGLLSSPPTGGTPRHAVACHGMVGDLDASSTCTMLGVDPRGFSSINMTFWQFQSQFSIAQILYRR